MNLLDGVGFIGMAIGLFAVSEILVNIEEPIKQVFSDAKLGFMSLFPNLQDWKDSFGALWRGSLLGFFIGTLPGSGATLCSFIAYAVEKKVSKHPEKFGTGVIEGVAAPEGANNSAAGGAMVPLLTLGIPSGGATAVMLGALMIHGLRPGPMLFTTNPEFVWGLIASMYIGNVFLVILNMPLIGIWVKLLKVPYKVLMPLILTISATGIFATDNNVFDMWIMFFFGMVGYLMRNVAPAVAHDLARQHIHFLHPSHLRGADGHRLDLPLLPPAPNPLDQVQALKKGPGVREGHCPEWTYGGIFEMGSKPMRSFS